MEPDAPRVHPALEPNLMGPFSARHGEDVDALFESAAGVISEELRVHRHGAVPMEPRALVYEDQLALLGG